MAILLAGYLGVVIALGLLSGEDVKLSLPTRMEAPPDITEAREIEGELP